MDKSRVLFLKVVFWILLVIWSIPFVYLITRIIKCQFYYSLIAAAAVECNIELVFLGGLFLGFGVILVFIYLTILSFVHMIDKIKSKKKKQ